MLRSGWACDGGGGREGVWGTRGAAQPVVISDEETCATCQQPIPSPPRGTTTPRKRGQEKLTSCKTRQKGDALAILLRGSLGGCLCAAGGAPLSSRGCCEASDAKKPDPLFLRDRDWGKTMPGAAGGGMRGRNSERRVYQEETLGWHRRGGHSAELLRRVRGTQKTSAWGTLAKKGAVSLELTSLWPCPPPEDIWAAPEVEEAEEDACRAWRPSRGWGLRWGAGRQQRAGASDTDWAAEDRTPAQCFFETRSEQSRAEEWPALSDPRQSPLEGDKEANREKRMGR